MVRPLITPSDIPTATTSRCLVFPDSLEWKAIINGLLGNAIDAINWQQIDGITPEEAAQECRNILEAFFNADECEGVQTFMIGEIKMYTSLTLPNGWLPCYGQELLRDEYPDLFAVIGTEFYFGTDPDYFAIPNFKRRSPMGVNESGSGTPLALNELHGEENHTLLTGELPVHSHVERANAPGAAIVNFKVGTAVSGGNFSASGYATNGTTDLTTGNAGSGTPHNTVHPVNPVMFMIFTGVIE